MLNQLPVVCLIGRTNVGKSTLFNTFIAQHHHLVDALPNTTRDIVIDQCRMDDQTFFLADSPGIDSTFLNINAHLDLFFRHQVDLFVLVLDANQTLTAAEIKFIHSLRQYSKPTLCLLNKIDQLSEREVINDYQILKIKVDPLLISAKQHFGLAALKTKISAHLTNFNATFPQTSAPQLKIALVGRSNAGKSTLFNALFGQEVALVSPTLHTTLDPVVGIWNKYELQAVFYDTAGLSQHALRLSSLLQKAKHQTLYTILAMDIILMVINAAEGLTSYDLHILALIRAKHKPCLVVVNKIDLLTATELLKLKAGLKYDLTNFNNLPIIYASALLKTNLSSVLKHLKLILNEEQRTFEAEQVELIVQKLLFLYSQTVSGQQFRLKHLALSKHFFSWMVALEIKPAPRQAKNLQVYLHRHLRFNLQLKYLPLKIVFQHAT